MVVNSNITKKKIYEADNKAEQPNLDEEAKTSEENEEENQSSEKERMNVKGTRKKSKYAMRMPESAKRQFWTAMGRKV